MPVQGEYVIYFMSGFKYTFMDKRVFLNELSRKLKTNLYKVKYCKSNGKDSFEVTLSNKSMVHESKKKKVLWFSRHDMTEAQRKALGDVDIVKVDRTINSARDIKDVIDKCDIIAIVAPLSLQKSFLIVADDKPVIMAKTKRFVNADGSKSPFEFEKWERIISIDIIKEDFDIKEIN